MGPARRRGAVAASSTAQVDGDGHRGEPAGVDRKGAQEPTGQSGVFAAAMNPSTRAWTRWRACRRNGCPLAVLVAVSW